jgi:hypothetical protein
MLTAVALSSSVTSAAAAGAEAPGTDPAPDVDASHPLTRLQWERHRPDEWGGRVAGWVEASVMREELGRWNIGGCGQPNCRSSGPGFHPGTRVIVEASSISARRKNAQASRAILRLQSEFRSRGYWLYRNCFELNAHEPADRGGETWLRVQASPSGTVVQSRIISTTLSSHAMAECVRNVTRTIRVAAVDRRHSTFRLRIRVFPGDVPLPSASLTTSRGGQLNPIQLGTLVDPLRKAIEQCVANGIERDAALWGRLSLALQVSTDGRIETVREVESQFPDPAVIACCRSALLDLNVPRALPAGELRLALRVGELAQARPPEPAVSQGDATPDASLASPTPAE